MWRTKMDPIVQSMSIKRPLLSTVK